jgi:hypothetical protein
MTGIAGTRTRDHRFERTRSYEYVNRDIYGAEDLDDSGDWVDSQYGRAWHPRVAADWALYRNGHWAWIDYYGWTWVSDDSWGWAPYHYGNWFYENSLGWAWYPGAYDYPHYYWSPALVAFVGFGHGNLAMTPPRARSNIGSLCQCGLAASW